MTLDSLKFTGLDDLFIHGKQVLEFTNFNVPEPH